MKCKIKMVNKILPVEGSVKGSDHNATGTCPECDTPGVMLSIVGGFVRAHVVSSVETAENNPQPPTLVPGKGKKVGTGLSEPVVDLVDTGARIGDPRTAEQRRVAEIEGAAGIGTVQVPRKVPTGALLKSGAPRMTTKLTDVPATEEHVREALEYWRKRKVSSDTSRARQSSMVSLLARRLEAIMEAQAVRYDMATRTLVSEALPVAVQPKLSATTDSASAHRGPTLVRGRDTAPRLRDPETPWDEGTDLRRDGTVRKSTTFEQPLGRERFDRKITDVPEPKPRLTEAQRRRHRRKLVVKGLISRQRDGK